MPDYFFGTGGHLVKSRLHESPSIDIGTEYDLESLENLTKLHLVHLFSFHWCDMKYLYAFYYIKLFVCGVNKIYA